MVTPVMLISGYLGSGKTTLVRHILRNTQQKIAVILNEFGDIGIDTQTVQKQNMQVKEILEGCVCCSLTGELNAALKDIVKDYGPQSIIIETTGIAEPDNLVFTLDKELDFVKLDTVVTVVDADASVRFPALSGNFRIQIRMADIVLLNKADLVSKQDMGRLHRKIKQINSRAPIIDTVNCVVDVDMLFENECERHVTTSDTESPHGNLEGFTLDFPSCTRKCAEQFLKNLPKEVYRAKGSPLVDGHPYMINYVAGRWSFEPVKTPSQKMVFIGQGISKCKGKINKAISACVL